MVYEPFEMGPIRPPSEAYSLLIRVTRNCPWNRCRFCATYKGARFELRTVEEVKQDILAAKHIQDDIKAQAWKLGMGNNIRAVALAVMRQPPTHAHLNIALWMASGSQNVFLQDANSIIMRTPDLVEVIRFLKETFPGINRVTSYGRSHTAAHKTLDELKQIHEAGLTRLHIGLESGSDTVLKVMNKGVTAAQHIAGGQKVVASGISLSEYVLLGLGGQDLWREHAIETAKVLSAINPDFIRIRTLGIFPGLEMCADVESGAFIRQTDEGMVAELRLLIENLECTSNFASDHSGNLLQDVEGKLPEDRERMLAIIGQYQSMSPQERLRFRVGRRAGIYVSLDEMEDPRKRLTVEGIIEKLSKGTGEVDDDLVHTLRLRYT